MNSSDNPMLGICLRILSGVLFAGMFVSVKAVGEDVPLGEVVFFRAFFALIPLVIFLWWRREFPSGLATKRPLAHLLRSSLGAAALFFAFAALTRLNVAEAILIAQLSPVLTAIAAVVLLAERLTIWRVAGIALGFAGVVTLVWPELQSGAIENSRLIGTCFGVASAVLASLALIMVRSLNRTESPGAIALYFCLASMLASLCTLPWGWLNPSTTTLIYLILAGLFGGFGQIAMRLSFKHTEASRLAPFEYIAFLWPLIADLFIFDLPLSATFLLAAPLVLMGGAVAAMEGRKPARAVSG